MSGMKENPCESHALADRFRCAKCMESPRLSNAKYDKDSGIITATLNCHGKSKPWSGTKSELMRIKDVFEEDAPPPDDAL